MTEKQHDTSKEPIGLSFLLKEGARSGAGLEETARIASNLGLVETGRGLTSLSFRTSRTRFEELFGAIPVPASEGLDDLGFATRTGTLLDRDPVVPAELADYVEIVSVEPPTTMMRESTLGRGEEPTRGGDDVDHTGRGAE